MAGFGLMAFGTGPFGLGVPLTGAAPPEGPAGSRYINPATRDYEVDPYTGQLAQMPALRQRVLLALVTLLGSSTGVPEFGVRWPRKMGTTFTAEVNAAVRSALRHLTDTERVLRINSIIAEHGAHGRARVTVAYTDTSTGTADRVTTG